MKYLLILSLYHGGITVMPYEYPAKDECELAGASWRLSVNTEMHVNVATYFCTPSTRY